MPFIIALPLMLRLGATLVFLLAVVAAGALNRSLVMVPLLAATATLTHWLVGKVVPNPLKNIQGIAGNVAVPGRSPQALLMRFIAGTIGYGMIFMVTVFLSAIFQETELERALDGTDALILAVPAGIAALLSIATAYTGANQVTGMAADLHQTFARGHTDPHGLHDEDAFTVEGEIIDPDDLKS